MVARCNDSLALHAGCCWFDRESTGSAARCVEAGRRRSRHASRALCWQRMDKGGFSGPRHNLVLQRLFVGVARGGCRD